MSSNGEIRVLLADDDPVIRDGLSDLLDGQEDIAMVATAANGVEAIAAMGSGVIDVALIDVDMPILDGIETTKLIHKTYPDTVIVMLTAFEHEDSLAQSINAGAQGFLTKDIPADQLAQLIKQAYAGQPVYGAKPAILLTDSYANLTQARDQYREFLARVENLPVHLRSTFNLLLEAQTNKEIAQRLRMTPSTIRSYVSDILAHTGCTSRGELAITAIKAGVEAV
ncbi:MAG: response regulator transcription factor [Varibaculum sp.]|nr:response regulator transcription factor [Varibaculum sp.]